MLFKRQRRLRVFRRRAGCPKGHRNFLQAPCAHDSSDNVSKQNGHQLLFVEASAALQRGEKVGLVGPNGSGKTTLFRMITGEEQPDEGQVAVDRGVTIGYFSQDAGEMSGRSAVSEVMDGAGPGERCRFRVEGAGGRHGGP